MRVLCNAMNRRVGRGSSSSSSSTIKTSARFVDLGDLGAECVCVLSQMVNGNA